MLLEDDTAQCEQLVQTAGEAIAVDVHEEGVIRVAHCLRGLAKHRHGALGCKALAILVRRGDADIAQ